jgi:glycosyltransferase involved in cell wall biosynthesis
MRVLMVNPVLPTPACPSSTAFIARQIDSIRAAGVAVDVLEIKGIRGLKYLQCLPRFHALARSADLVHAHYGYHAWLARTRLDRPLVVTYMGDDLLGTPDAAGRATPFSRLAVRIDCWLGRLVDSVIVQSTEMAKIIAPLPVHILPYGIDVAAFRPIDRAAARAELGWDAERRYVLFGSNPANPRKGFPLFEAALTHASTRLGAPIVPAILWGVPPERVPLYMNACDALLLTSMWEGSPNVVKEAMACDTPVISVPIGDVRELLDGVAGCAVRPRDPAALGATLAEMLAAGRRTDGRATLLRLGLDQETVAHRTIAIYREVLQRRGVPRPAPAAGPAGRG